MEKISPRKLIEILSVPSISDASKQDWIRIYSNQIRSNLKVKAQKSDRKKRERINSNYESFVANIGNEAQELTGNLKNFLALQKEIKEQPISKQEIMLFLSLKELTKTIYQIIQSKNQ